MQEMGPAGRVKLPALGFVSSQTWLPLPAPFLCPDSVSGHTGLTPCARRY